MGLDVGQENAQFASLEIDYGETDDKNSLVVTGGVKKSLVIYEMDFGMNYVIRKKELEVPETAHLLMAGSSAVTQCQTSPMGQVGSSLLAKTTCSIATIRSRRE